MTPSSFLQAEKVRGVSRDAPDLGSPASMEGPDPKASQEEANYGGAEAKCSTCEYFDGTDGCSRVDGVIDPGGHSRFYSPGASEESPIGEDTAGMDFGE